jgi:hypothetical protein
VNIHFITALQSRPVSWKCSLSLWFPLHEPLLSPVDICWFWLRTMKNCALHEYRWSVLDP